MSVGMTVTMRLSKACQRLGTTTYMYRRKQGCNDYVYIYMHNHSAQYTMYVACMGQLNT